MTDTALRPLLTGLIFACSAPAAISHGGGLNAEGCHTNRKTGDYHCHRGGSVAKSPAAATTPAASALSRQRAAPSGEAGPTCYTGPRGGTYTITATGRKNYGGC